MYLSMTLMQQMSVRKGKSERKWLVAAAIYLTDGLYFSVVRFGSLYYYQAKSMSCMVLSIIITSLVVVLLVVVRLFRAMCFTCCFNVCLLNIVGVLDTKFSCTFIFCLKGMSLVAVSSSFLSFFSLTLIICPSSKIGGCLIFFVKVMIWRFITSIKKEKTRIQSYNEP